MFKRGAGLAVTLAIAVAAMRYAGPASQQSSGGVKPPAHPASISIKNPNAGGCSAYDPAIQPTPGKPYDGNSGAAKKALDSFFGFDTATEKDKLPVDVRFAIAITPDPVHTHLSLMFDREISVVQQAAQDDGYIYDSSWFPWAQEGDASLAYLADRQYASDLTDEREACPGVILFRKNLEEADSKQAGEAYRESLVVLVVGEQATGGINDDQWHNTLQWLRKYAKGDKLTDKVGDGVLPILGPTFTGSLESLERDLAEAYKKPATKQSSRTIGAMYPEARVLSGSVTGCSEIQWFEHRLQQSDELNGHVRFGTFQENDALHTFRFLEYLKSQGTHLSDVAILSEDETAYAAISMGEHKFKEKTASTVDANGRAPETSGDPNKKWSPPASRSLCDFPYGEEDRPMHLVYPRDISAIRDAYEKQSLFDTSEASKRTSRAILKDEVEDKPAEEITDTVPTFSANESALAQEAYLFGVVSFLRTHHSRYLILRCTNPLDFLFLARFFHREYPQARIVTIGSDLLFRREIDTTEFRGVLALSSYPLIPRGQHWSTITEDHWDWEPHNHLVFEAHLTEGQYIASRYLFGDLKMDALVACGSPGVTACGDPNKFAPPIQMDRAFAVPDYGDPYWFHSLTCPQLPTHPPTWLVSVGRDGYWPLAVLGDAVDSSSNDAANRDPCTDPSFPHSNLGGSPDTVPSAPRSTMVELHGEWKHNHAVNDRHYQLAMSRKDQSQYAEPPQYSKWLQLSYPLPWLCCLLLSILLAVYQTWGVIHGSRRAYRIFSIFLRTYELPQETLFACNCALALMPLIEIIGFGLFPKTLSSMGNPDWKLQGVGYLVALLAGMIVCLASLYSPRTAAMFTVFLAGMSAIYWFAFCTCGELTDANRVPLVYRMAHLTDGVSPLLPILLLTLGFYLWSWHAIAGNLMLSPGYPELPKPKNGKAGGVHSENLLDDAESRLSQKVADKVLQMARPLSVKLRIIAFPGFLLIAALLCFGYPPNLPLLSLEGRPFDMALNLLLLGGFLMTVAEALRIYFTWLSLQRLLQAMSRLRLRRTLAQLRPIEASSLWSVSGNVPRIQYLLFVKQLGAAHRIVQLSASTLYPRYAFHYLNLALRYGDKFKEGVEHHVERGILWNMEVKLPKAGAVPPPKPEKIRPVLADAVGEVINTVLLKAWEEETTSLNFVCAPEDGKDGKGTTLQLPLCNDPQVRAAEEFVCFHYIAFIQNIVARIRTMTLSMISLFVSVCFAISFYPFVPRTEITLWMMLNLLLIGSSAAYVYAGMERDEIMSYITNSKPGELGAEFWVKLSGFLIGPIIGILTTQFPSIADSVLGWLQPGLDAIK